MPFVLRIVNQLNTLAQQSSAAANGVPTDGVADLVGNQSGLVSGSGCGPMGICLDATGSPTPPPSITPPPSAEAPPNALNPTLLHPGILNANGPKNLDTDYIPDSDDLIETPMMSASPVITAIFIIVKTVTMISLGSVIGPAVSLYVIASSHWRFLERIEMVSRQPFYLSEKAFAYSRRIVLTSTTLFKTFSMLVITKYETPC